MVIKTKTGIYRVVHRDSAQIQVFNEDSGEKEIARKILGQFIDENNYHIDHQESGFNTRTIGKKFFEHYYKLHAD